MKLYIRNMVCSRCIAVVKAEFKNLGYDSADVQLGEVELSKTLSDQTLEKLKTRLISHGFEIIDDKKSKLIEKIKTTIIKDIQNSENTHKGNYSNRISEVLNKDYSYLSKLFSEIEGITIEQFLILQKIEKVKELLVYNELSLSEIADKVGYSSVAHLSKQFKKTTGLTPSHFKKVKTNKRLSLDSVKPQKV